MARRQGHEGRTAGPGKKRSGQEMEGCQCGVLTATARDGRGPNWDRVVSRTQERGLAVSAHSLEGRDESGHGVPVVPFPPLTLHEREERGSVPCLHGCRQKKRRVYVPAGDCRAGEGGTSQDME